MCVCVSVYLDAKRASCLLTEPPVFCWQKQVGPTWIVSCYPFPPAGQHFPTSPLSFYHSFTGSVKAVKAEQWQSSGFALSPTFVLLVPEVFWLLCKLDNQFVNHHCDWDAVGILVALNLWINLGEAVALSLLRLQSMNMVLLFVYSDQFLHIHVRIYSWSITVFVVIWCVFFMIKFNYLFLALSINNWLPYINLEFVYTFITLFGMHSYWNYLHRWLILLVQFLFFY